MKINRRNFLKTGVVSGAMFIGGCSTIGEETASNVSNVLTSELTLGERIERSISLIGEREFAYFVEIFSINTHDDYRDVLGKIQANNGLIKDYIIGPNTLKILYDTVYPRMNNLPFEIAERIEISRELQELYSQKPHFGLGHASSSRFFSQEHLNHNMKYLEDGLEEYIDTPDSLGKYIESQNFEGSNSLIIRKVGGMLRMFYFDTNGALDFASSTSTGTTENGGEKTKKWNGIRLTGIMEIDKTSIQFGKVVMPYAVHISHGIWIHGGAVSGNDASKGCIRLPYNAAKHFWEIATENNPKDMKIFVEDNEI